MNASDVMIRAVATVRPDTPIAEVAKLIMLNDVSALPVVDDEGGPSASSAKLISCGVKKSGQKCTVRGGSKL